MRRLQEMDEGGDIVVDPIEADPGGSPTGDPDISGDSD